MELNDLLTDTKSINEGMWVLVDPSMFGDLEIKSKGFTDEFVDAQGAAMRMGRTELGLNADDPLPNKVQRRINAQLLKDHLVLDVRNLLRDGQPVSIDEFHKLLGQENAIRLSRACWAAAARVTYTKKKVEDADLGN